MVVVRYSLKPPKLALIKSGLVGIFVSPMRFFFTPPTVSGVAFFLILFVRLFVGVCTGFLDPGR